MPRLLKEYSYSLMRSNAQGNSGKHTLLIAAYSVAHAVKLVDKICPEYSITAHALKSYGYSAWGIPNKLLIENHTTYKRFPRVMVVTEIREKVISGGKHAKNKILIIKKVFQLGYEDIDEYRLHKEPLLIVSKTENIR